MTPTLTRGSSSMGRTAAVIFDLDGVLVDSEPFLARCLHQAFLERYRVDIPTATFLGLAGTGVRCITEPARQHGVDLDLEAFRKYLFTEIYARDAGDGLRPFPGVVELLRDCRAAGIKMAVASNASPQKVDINLAAIGLPFGVWDAVLTLSDIERPKPDPEIYFAAAKRLGVATEDCTVVEDSPSGIAAARGAGMFTIAVGSSFPADLLWAAGADVLKERFADISLATLKVGKGL